MVPIKRACNHWGAGLAWEGRTLLGRVATRSVFAAALARTACASLVARRRRWRAVTRSNAMSALPIEG